MTFNDIVDQALQEAKEDDRFGFEEGYEGGNEPSRVTAGTPRTVPARPNSQGGTPSRRRSRSNSITRGGAKLIALLAGGAVDSGDKTRAEPRRKGSIIRRDSFIAGKVCVCGGGGGGGPPGGANILDSAGK